VPLALLEGPPLILRGVAGAQKRTSYKSKALYYAQNFNRKIQKGETMTTRITKLIQTSTMNILRLALLSSLVAAMPLFADDFAHANHNASAKLVREVQDATKQFIDVGNLPTDYKPLFGCVSGTDHGAMGIHYVDLSLVGDGEIDLRHPEAVIYEPVGRYRRLVGVEYIVDAPTWLAAHDNTPPMLEGQAFHLVGTPNQFAIPSPFFELHVWAWRDNPQGAFVDWNNLVTCEAQ